ncbi:MAG: PQQ-binding-like beta-propeller repeat protein [Pedosphaera sp.]|jgi:outer membrane protein assembly factor BamB|nr:PQQ-binding-like beta-propeller repeat protein [Pedosphaera sp.]
MNSSRYFSAICLFSLVTLGQAADWPTYQHDYARTGVARESLLAPFTDGWVHRSRHAPRPAWRGEAKWDGYNKVYDLKSRQIFDYAYHPVIADGLLYYGSSADDKIYCLDATTGEQRWTFFTEGPVRLAPTIAEGRVFVGSDDGHAYCLDAKSGTLVWKTQLGLRDYRIPGNSRIISRWPLRTGIVVIGDLAYCAAGMFPSEGVLITAIEADTGKIKWQQKQTDLPAQGYMLASHTRLYVPAGRNNPVVLNRADGKRIRVVSGQGGTYALLTGDNLVFGPGKTGTLGFVESNQSDQLATFKGNHMIVTPSRSFLQSDTDLSALDRSRYLDLARKRRPLKSRLGKLQDELKKVKAGERQRQILKEAGKLGKQLDEVQSAMQECFAWRVPSSQPLSMVLAGQTLITGGHNEVAAYSAKDGSQLWRARADGEVFGLAVADGRLYTSTSKGVIHCYVARRLGK